MHRLSNSSREVHILLVEDNPGDVLLTKKAFEYSKLANEISVAPDGEIALKMLQQEGEYAGFPLPDIILLDLNLPKKDGKEVLKEIKESETLKAIPTVVLTSSKAEEDIVKAYNLHANSYLTKPVNFEKFKEVISCIENFWFKVVVYPN